MSFDKYQNAAGVAGEQDPDVVEDPVMIARQEKLAQVKRETSFGKKLLKKASYSKYLMVDYLMIKFVTIGPRKSVDQCQA